MSFFSYHKQHRQFTGNIDISNTTCRKPAGVKFDHKLTFDDPIFELCKKARRKIHPSARVKPYMNLSKKRIFMNAYFNSQFSY